jgi:ATP-dependent Clp protease protease subunit
MKYPFYTPIDEALFESRTVHVSGGVNSALAYEVTRQLFALERADASKPITLIVNSPGGEVTSGFSIFDVARFIKPEVRTVVAGLAASMGSIISLAARKENRFCLPNAKFLIHQPLIGGQIFGPASDIEIHANDIIKTRERINRLYADETGRPIEEIAKATDRDRWMDPPEALSFGLISRVISSRAEMPV